MGYVGKGELVCGAFWEGKLSLYCVVKVINVRWQ